MLKKFVLQVATSGSSGSNSLSNLTFRRWIRGTRFRQPLHDDPEQEHNEPEPDFERGSGREDRGGDGGRRRELQEESTNDTQRSAFSPSRKRPSFDPRLIEQLEARNPIRSKGQRQDPQFDRPEPPPPRRPGPGPGQRIEYSDSFGKSHNQFERNNRPYQNPRSGPGSRAKDEDSMGRQYDRPLQYQHPRGHGGAATRALGPNPAPRITKLLDNAATFEDALHEQDYFIEKQRRLGKQTLPKTMDGSIDPFISSPYTLETKFPNQYFPGGESAMEEAIRKKINPSTTSIILFPGQGTQFVGMCGDPSKLSKSALDLYNNASEILQYDLLDLCAHGPIEKLNQTQYCQPAIVVSSLAALEKLRETNEYAIESCVSTAGFSIGEMTALIFGGCLGFEDAIKLVKIRAEAMQIASEMVPSGMATVLYRPDSQLNFGLKVARSWCEREFHIENPICTVANYLFPHCKVIAGHIQAIEFLEKNYTDFKLKKVKRLPVSGAFHTKLMKPAQEALELALKDIEISPPRIPVFSNESGFRYHTSNEVRLRLPQQVTSPVVWEQVVHNIYSRPKGDEYPSTYECGPGTSLTTVLKMVNARAHAKIKRVEPLEAES